MSRVLTKANASLVLSEGFDAVALPRGSDVEGAGAGVSSLSGFPQMNQLSLRAQLFLPDGRILTMCIWVLEKRGVSRD